MKLNIKGLIALVVLVFSLIVLGYDFINLLKGATYTWFGLSTAIALIFAGSEAYDYIEDRLK